MVVSKEGETSIHVLRAFMEKKKRLPNLWGFGNRLDVLALKEP